ncbi:DeoR/GlpR family DNA-binding transcription regulator [Salinivibrio costicola]|uniref:DeoR/GlpR family DNA-binding transcription regulator n=1 Tax=Salinivibrio costicola TaxID=51367 RepID=UPI003F727BB4
MTNDLGLNWRQRDILSQLADVEHLETDHLAAHFSVTTQTIRRDINQLCALGLARRHHGGINMPSAQANSDYQRRLERHRGIKTAIAQAVAERIPDGATVILGIGTTVSAIAEQLLTRRDLRVITNNVQIAHILGANSDLEIWLAGGKLRANDQDMVGHSVIQFLSRFQADIAIIGCAAVSEEGWACEFSPDEADVSDTMLEAATARWLVADGSKWQRSAPVKVKTLKQFDYVFTDHTELASDIAFVPCAF